MESKEEKIERSLKDFRFDEKIEDMLLILELRYGEHFTRNHITRDEVRDILLKRIDGLMFDWTHICGSIVPI